MTDKKLSTWKFQKPITLKPDVEYGMETQWDATGKLLRSKILGPDGKVLRDSEDDQ